MAVTEMQSIDKKLKPLTTKIKEMKSDLTTLENSLKDHVSITYKIKRIIMYKILKKLIYYQLSMLN